MPNPLETLHNNMVQSDLLTGENSNYETFLSNLADDAGRMRLYNVLKDNGKVSMPYQDFVSGYFADYKAPEKKKIGGDTGETYSEPSLDGSAPVQTADTPSEGNFFDYPTSYHPLNKPDMGGGVPVDDSPVDLGLSNAQLADKIKSASILRQDAANTGIAQPESTSTNIPHRSLPKMDITGAEDPLEYGDQHFRKMDNGYDYKEKYAAKSPWRKGTRDLEKITVYADRSKKQSDFANFGMSEKYGTGWLDEMNNLSAELQQPAASASPDEIMEKQAKVNRMKEDPLFQAWQSGIIGQNNSSNRFKEAVKENPGYLKALADKEKAERTANDSMAFKAASFVADITGPVVSGIATLPRTLLSAAGVQDVPVIEQIADWGDKQKEFVETQTSTGSKSNRPLWENMTAFDGMEVVVDTNGRPVTAYKGGNKVDLTDDQVKKFMADGAGKAAKLSYTGWENAGWSTAKQLANLYLMRSLGGGTEIGTGATAFVTTYNDLYNEALSQLGYSPADAAQYAMANAGVQAAAEAYLGKIDVAPIKLNMARSLGVKEAKALAGTMSAKEVGRAAGKAMMKEVLGENAEELVQTATDHLATAMFNAKTGGDIRRNFDAQQLAETILLTTATTLLAGGADMPRATRNEMRVNALLAATQNPEAVQPAVQAMVAAGQITEQDAGKVQKRMAALSQVEEALPEEMKEEDKAYVLALELEKMAKQEQVTKETPKTVQEEVKSQVAEIDKTIEAVKDPSSVPEGEPSPIKDAPVEVEVMPPAPEIEPPTAIVNKPENVLPPTGPVQDTIDPTSLISEDIAPLLDQSDKENVTNWVNDNLADPEVMAEYPSREEAATALVKEYEDNVLRNKYTPKEQAPEARPRVKNQRIIRATVSGYVNEVIEGTEQEVDKKLKEIKKAQEAAIDSENPEVMKRYKKEVAEYNKRIQKGWVATRPDMPDFVKNFGLKVSIQDLSNPRMDTQQATEIARTLDDDQANKVVNFTQQYTDANGDVDIDRMQDDIESGRVEAPEAVNQILNEQEVTGLADADQRNQGVDGNTQSSSRQGNAQPIDAPEDVNLDDPTEGLETTPEPQKHEMIKKRLKKAPLPVLDDDVLRELNADGHITEDEFYAAARYMDGDMTQEAAMAYNKALDLRDQLRNLPPRKAMIVNEDIQVYQNEANGTLEVSGEAAGAYGLKYFGGKWNEVARKWIIPKESAEFALAHIVESNAPTVERADGGAAGSDLKDVMKSPGAVINSKRRRNRYKAASSFAERVKIAEVEHGTRAEVSDPRKVQKVIDRLKASMPGVNIVSDIAEFTSKVKEAGDTKGVTVEVRDGIPGYLYEDGRWEAPVAFEMDGTVYINPRLAHVDALIHEFGHLWNSWMRVNNPEELARGVEMVKDTDYVDAVKNNPLYSDLSEDQVLEEALAYAIGDAGRRISDMTPFMRFRVWLSDMWRTIARATGIQRAQEMTLLQWANYHAETLLSGNEVTRQSGKAIVDDEQRQASMQKAQAMERAGWMPEEIKTATGWKRSDSGDWYQERLDFVIRYDDKTEFEEGAERNLSDVISVPDIAQAFPDAEIPVRIQSGVKTPRMDGKTIVISPVISDDYVAKVVELAQSKLIPDRLDTLPAQDNQRSPRFMALGKPQQNMVQGSTTYAARHQSARQIVRIEIQNEGMKDYEAKTRQLSQALGLRYDDVLKIWQEEADAARHGRFVLALGDAKSMGAGKWAQIVEAADIKASIASKNISEWFRRYFTVKGLFPAEIKHLADQLGNQISGRLRHARFLINDLNTAMKAEYGNPSEGHWRLVDNVLRGEGDWDVLPKKVRDAAVKIRDFTDSLSQELITSGATNSKMIITILNNSGVSATQQNLEDYNGVNLFEALDTLPYMRTPEQDAAIKDFLKRNNRMLGAYFYRSYRKHRDKDWAKKVPPQVLADAREFLTKEITNRIAVLEAARDAKVDDLEDQIQDWHVAISAVKDQIEMAKDAAQAELDAITNTIRHTKTITPELRQKQSDAQAELDKWLDVQSEAKGIVGADLMTIMDLTEADMSAYSDMAWSIIEARQQIINLQDIQDAAIHFNQAELDNLERILSVPYGAKQGGIDGLIYNEILAQEDTQTNMVSNARLGSKDLAFIKKRKNIPAPIRDLMGEYHDARLNFATSVVRLINVIENQKFLSNIREQYEGKYFWPPEMADMGVELASRGTPAMDPLNGWRTTPEIAKAFRDYYNPRAQMPWPVRALRYFSDMVKYGKTIVSPVTHFRNFFSNIYFAVQNGYDIRQVTKGATGFKNAWSNMIHEQQREYIERLVSLGIVGEGAWSADMKNLMERLDADSVDQLMISGSVWGNANKMLQRTYQAEDDFWRIVGFETEKQRYSKATYGKKYEDLNPSQKAEMEQKAADIVAYTMPTYSNVPRFASALREIPLFGTFIAFPAEMFRITANQVKLTIRESNDPRTRGIAFTRMAGMALAQGIPAGIVSLFRHLVGVGDDEEDAARYFVPEWQRTSPWIWETFEPGKIFSFRNLGYSDPYAFYKKPIVSMFTNNGKDVSARLGEAAWGMLSPFIDVELTTGTILALAYNKKPGTEDPVYNPGAGIIGDWQASLGFATKQLQPGLVKFGFDVKSAATGESMYGKPPKQWDDIALNMVGYQTESTDIEKAVRQKSYQAKKSLDWARELFIRNQFRMDTDQEKAELYQRTTEQYNKALKELSLCIRNAEIIGVPPDIVNEIVAGPRRGFSDDELNMARHMIVDPTAKLYPEFKGYNK